MTEDTPPVPPTPAFVPDPALDGPPGGVEPFAPPSDAWRRVSPRLTGAKRIATSITLALIVLPIVAGVLLIDLSLWWVAALVLAAGLALWLWLFLRAARLVAAYGWARRDKDLCFVEGLMFRNLHIVPFGRLQVVKVSAGPLLRARGLATVEMVTATEMANVTVPGLPADEAKALRDLLIELSDAEGSGL